MQGHCLGFPVRLCRSGTDGLSPRWSDESPRWQRMGCDECLVGPPGVYGGAYGPIVRPVVSAATASRKLTGGVRCAH